MLQRTALWRFLEGRALRGSAPAIDYLARFRVFHHVKSIAASRPPSSEAFEIVRYKFDATSTGLGQVALTTNTSDPDDTVCLCTIEDATASAQTLREVLVEYARVLDQRREPVSDDTVIREGPACARCGRQTFV